MVAIYRCTCYSSGEPQLLLESTAVDEEGDGQRVVVYLRLFCSLLTVGKSAHPEGCITSSEDRVI